MRTKTKKTFSFGTYLCTFCLSPIIFSLWQKMVHHNFTDVRTCPCSLPSLIRGKSMWLYGMLFQISLVLRLLLKLKSLKSFFKRYRKFIARSLWLKNHKSELNIIEIDLQNPYPSITGVLSKISLARLILSSEGIRNWVFCHENGIMENITKNSRQFIFIFSHSDKQTILKFLSSI